MPTYLYCLIPADHEPPGETPPGVDGAAVRALPLGPLDAWVSTIAETVLIPDVGRARAHDTVIRSAMSRATPLPARFGQIMASDEALSQWLNERQDALVRTCERVSGCVEMTVRVLMSGGAEPVGAGVPPHDSGVAYLHWLRARQQAQRAVANRAQRLHEDVELAVEGIVRAAERAFRDPTSPAAGMLELAHLVPRELITRHRDALHTLVEGTWALRLMLSGPWAPYTFCAAMHE